MIIPSVGFGLMPLVLGLAWLAITVVASVLVFRHARRRGASDGIAALAAVVCFLTSPLGYLAYVVLAVTGLVDSIVASVQGSARPGGAPTSPQAPPAGWYDDPEGGGQRWWDGTAWTEHSQGR